MFRLKDKVVVRFGRESSDNSVAANTFIEAILDQFWKIGTPAAKVIVCVYGRNPRLLGPPLECAKSLSHRQRVLQKVFTARELQIVNHVDQQ